MKRWLVLSGALLAVIITSAQNIERIKYGDFNNWVTRYIHESAVLGGNKKTIYEIGPTATIEGNKPYISTAGSPWGTSNVYAKVSGIVKGSNAVFPHDRGNGNQCAKLATVMDNVKVLGMINMDVMVAGSIFLGKMIEPVTGTKNPYSKMDMGVPYTKRPASIILDYKVEMPDTDFRVKSTGFGGKKTLPGHDDAVVFAFFQRRWEDADGHIHAKRVGTAGKLFSSASDWVNGFTIPVIYGDASVKPGFAPYLALRDGHNAYYAKNSKGKMVPVIEEGWDTEDAVPTHVILMLSAGNGEPYVGTEGLNFYVDNIGFKF